MTLVLGADAADLDSFCCVELLRQYYHSRGRVVQALFPIPQAQLSWRIDVQAMVEYLGRWGWRNSLCYLDTFDELLLDRADLEIQLVDRHQLPSDWLHVRPWLGKQVTGIIDHRPDSGALPGVGSRLVDPQVVSCATLLYEILEPQRELPQVLLLAAAIAQDSELLQSPRTSERDRRALLQLRSLLAEQHWQWLQGLPALRRESALLPALQQLWQDLKWTHHPRVPLAVVQSSAADFWALADAQQAGWQLAAQAEGKTPLLLILHKPPRPALRELSLLYSACIWPNWLLQLLEWAEAQWTELGCTHGCRVLRLGNSSLTRKDLLFKIEQAMECESGGKP